MKGFWKSQGGALIVLAVICVTAAIGFFAESINAWAVGVYQPARDWLAQQWADAQPYLEWIGWTATKWWESPLLIKLASVVVLSTIVAFLGWSPREQSKAILWVLRGFLWLGWKLVGCILMALAGPRLAWEWVDDKFGKGREEVS